MSNQTQVQKTTTEEICGAETNRGGTCQNKAESCPWHNENGERTDVENGRKTKYNEERVQDMVDAAKDGLPMHSIARAGGISVETLYTWMDEKPDFSERLKQARTEAERKLAKEAAKKDPRYMLTRSFKWDKPSADTVINNTMQQSQSQEESFTEALQEAYKEVSEGEKTDG